MFVFRELRKWVWFIDLRFFSGPCEPFSKAAVWIINCWEGFC